MAFLKNLATVLLFVLLGAGLGLAAFYFQKSLSPSSSEKSQATASPTPRALGSTASGVTYASKGLGLNLALPSNTMVLEEPAPGLASQSAPAYSLTFLTKTADLSLAPTDTVLYGFVKDGLTAGQAATLRQSLRRLALAGTRPDPTFQDTGAGGPLAPKGLLNSQGKSLRSYELDGPSRYLLLLAGGGDASLSGGEASLSALLQSLQAGSAPAASPTPTPTPGPSADLLNQ